MSRYRRGIIASSIRMSQSKRISTIVALNASDWLCITINHARNTLEMSGIRAVGKDFASATSHRTSHVHPKPFGTMKSAPPDGMAMDGCTRATTLASGFRGVIHADGYAGFNELFVGG